ncbi:MAG TPA: anti-sigma factor [Brevundimonas sp.]
MIDADPDTPDILAGELALRVLSPADEAAARAREAGDPAFAAQVDGWNERIAAFADEVAPVEPSPRVWPRIDAGTAARAANDNDRVTFWRRWAVGSTGLLAASVAALAVVMAQPEPTPVAPPTPQPVAGVVKVATLTLSDGDAPAMTLVYDAVSGNLYLAPTDKMAGDKRVPHLWLVMPDGGGVQLVGAIDGSEASRHHLSGALPDMAGHAVQVAVSMEAPGHTPAPQKPDGPVVASGEMQIL